MKHLNLFLSLCIISPILGLLHRCPPLEDIPQQCACQKPSRESDVIVKCQGIENTHLLSEILSTFQNYVIDGMVISNGTLDMAAGPFRRLSIHRLTFENVRFATLPLLSSLNGIQQTLEDLTFEKCSVANWIWSNGAHFIHLRNLIFRKTKLPEILKNRVFGKFPKRIEKLVISDCKIKSLHPAALANFTFLKILKIEDNLIDSITRNSLAAPLPRLLQLSLRGNPLKNLPDNMFTQMPRLEFLWLGGTKLKTLHRETFDPVWDQLEEVLFNNIQLQCNCTAAWLIHVDRKKMPQSPSCLQNKKPIVEMTHKQLCPNEIN